MKFGKWITNHEYANIKYERPWETLGFGYHEFDRRGTDLYDDGGLVSFRKSFNFSGDGRILLRITALGVFEAYINGQRIGNVGASTVFDEMKPGWTDYRFHVMEFEYDVTPYCRTGENNLVIPVSNGWWSGRISNGFYGFRGVGLCAELEKIYSDGRCEYIASGEDWETAKGGKVRYADIWGGEYYDAREKDIAAESTQYLWQPASLYEDITCEIIPHIGETVRLRRTERPQSAIIYSGIKENGTDFGEINVISRHVGNGCEWGSLMAGEHLVLDLGANQTARPRIKLSSARDTTVRIYCAEMLNDSGLRSRGNDGPKGSAYLDNYRSALSRIMYVTAGGTEEYSPLFSFFGYRYLEICADGDIEIIEVSSDIIGSDLQRTGNIKTSNPEVNRLIENIVRGLDSNYLSVPTDCPQRDERLGWTGDTQIFCPSAAYLDSCYHFMRKWMMDLRDSQDEDGAYCFVAPATFGPDNYKGYNGVRGAAAWCDAGIIVPYRMWLMYGDTKILEESFDSMNRYMDFIRTKRGLAGPSPTYGDWLSYDPTPKEYVSVCYYAYDALLMTKICHVLGKNDTEAHYAALLEQIVAYYKENYMKDGAITVKSQTGLLLPLAFGMLCGEERERAIAELHENIVSNDYTLTTGFVGTGLLCTTLSEVGLHDDAYSLLLQTRDPSWLYSVRQGATTIWERWNSYTLEKGFGKVNMNSFNHYAYGAVAEWMFAYMAGIRPSEDLPGFRRVILSPIPDTRETLPKDQEHIRSVKASYLSAVGLIRAAWEYEAGEFVYRVTVPTGARAKILFPLLGDKTTVSVNGLEYREGEGCSIENGRICFELGGGSYTIR